MTLGSLVFLTPSAALVVLAAALPVGALALSSRRVRLVREALRLPEPPRAAVASTVAALVAIIALLAASAAQPAIRTRTTAVVRVDAQAMFVIDISRSMLAALSPTGAARLVRAKREAIALRAAIADVPAGVAIMTDRVLPSLLPDPDIGVFDQTVEHAVTIEQPPPENTDVVASSLGAVGAVGTQNYFVPRARRRLVVVLTDAETQPFDARAVARSLATGPGVSLVLVHVWQTGERVYDNGKPEVGYHEDRASGAAVDALATAGRGRAFGERQLAAAAAAERSAVGHGQTIREGRSEHTQTVAPYVALLALLPLLLVVRGAFRRREAV
ncbi:MAG TPA: hypothetical protein VGU02_01990 [Gaiellaceae bacterium]|nr:hypothetical protein [Gaiellaceae bacterium]